MAKCCGVSGGCREICRGNASRHNGSQAGSEYQGLEIYQPLQMYSCYQQQAYFYYSSNNASGSGGGASTSPRCASSSSSITGSNSLRLQITREENRTPKDHVRKLSNRYDVVRPAGIRLRYNSVQIHYTCMDEWVLNFNKLNRFFVC